MTSAVAVLGVVTVPGAASSVGAVRGFAGDVLGADHPNLDDVRLCLSELATNALRHSTSGSPGGRIEVLIAAGDGVIRVEVTDDGADGVYGAAAVGHRDRAGGHQDDGKESDAADHSGDADDGPDHEADYGAGIGDDGTDLAESGRGLPIVNALSVRWGIRPGPAGAGTTVWAEICGPLGTGPKDPGARPLVVKG